MSTVTFHMCFCDCRCVHLAHVIVLCGNIIIALLVIVGRAVLAVMTKLLKQMPLLLMYIHTVSMIVHFGDPFVERAHVKSHNSIRVTTRGWEASKVKVLDVFVSLQEFDQDHLVAHQKHIAPYGS